MLEKLIGKYVPVIVAVVVLGVGIKIIYQIVFSTASLAEKGWKPAVAFVGIILLLIAVLFVVLKKRFLQKDDIAEKPAKEKAVLEKPLDEQEVREAKKEELQQAMTVHNQKDKLFLRRTLNFYSPIQILVVFFAIIFPA